VKTNISSIKNTYFKECEYKTSPTRPNSYKKPALTSEVLFHSTAYFIIFIKYDNFETTDFGISYNFVIFCEVGIPTIHRRWETVLCILHNNLFFSYLPVGGNVLRRSMLH